MLQKAVNPSVLLLTGLLAAIVTAQEPAKPKAPGEQLTPPSCKYCPNPDYPAKARKALLPAKVLLQITVSEKGDVDPQDIRVIEDPGHGLAEKAVATVKNWKFNPATYNGKPVSARTAVHVSWPHEKH